jgi:competence protein ComEC
VVESVDRRNVAFVQKPSAFAEDCRRAEIVITHLKAPTPCAALVVLDREALAARGATTVRVDRDSVEIRSVRKGSEIIARARTPVTLPPGAAPKPARAVPEQDIPEPDLAEPDLAEPDDLSSDGPD